MKIVINNYELIITRHAYKRMRKRGIELEEMVEALEDSKLKHKQTKEGFSDRYLFIGKNDIAVVLSRDYVVVTVYRYNDAYVEAKSKHRKNKKRRQHKAFFGNRYKEP